MEKFCVFCGERPQDKNREHVIPRWLIEKTGDPNRKARFGLDFHSDPPQLREFSFDSLTFPACSHCNADFSKLEESAKSIITSLIACQALSELDLSTLLDWLDKVRVGLWLGYLYLDRNPMGIKPQYHISSRVGKSDRTVGILRMPGRHKGINFIGPESPCFQHSPTCFALLIDDFCFINVAGISICSKRLGFPFAQPRHLRDDGMVEVSIGLGTGCVMRPVLKDLVLAHAVLVHQPVYQICLEGAEARGALESEWLKRRSLKWEEGIGGVFIEKSDSVRRYPVEGTLDWLPDRRWELRQVYRSVLPLVYGRLIHDLKSGAVISGREQRKQLLENVAAYERIHGVMLARLRRERPWNQVEPLRLTGTTNNFRLG